MVFTVEKDFACDKIGACRVLDTRERMEGRGHSWELEVRYGCNQI